ncbi:Holliday junction resolvase-like protein [Chloroflexota bacterium]
MEAAVVVVVTVVVAVFIIFVAYYFIQAKFERRFRDWRETETVKWEEEKAKVAKVAITQSRAVLGGKFTEQMAPYLPEFQYDPTEARFIGSPIDLIVFPGLAQGDPREIIIMEIKTGNSQLTAPQKKIRQLIEDGMVRWELIQRQVEGEE